MGSAIRVRGLQSEDVPRAVLLHHQTLGMEFISRCGLPFLRRYYRGWLASPGGISLACVDDDDRVVGVLLGAVDPAGHIRAMVRRHGFGLALQLVLGALRRPALGKEVLVTRARRYAGGIWRLVTTRSEREPDAGITAGSDDGPVGEITHLVVDPGWQGMGLGRALVNTAVEKAREAGLRTIVLVTPPDLAARQFYERLGWQEDGAMTSRSGEPFVRYRYLLGRAPEERSSSEV
ncbi:MAG TPA: GNAT family N-acetyltransferase [Acidimicrobiales bacterium]|nr:GNAT family N-acetyltransferase [Acidimicrobiales bacterium]